MKIHQSTKDCAAYNETNNDAIVAGLLERAEPDDKILADEKKDEERKQAGFKQAQDILSVLKQLDPKTDGMQVCGVKAEIQGTYSSSSFNFTHVGWKLTLSSGHVRNANTAWMKIGDGKVLGLNTKQLAKAHAHIVNINAKEARDNAAQKLRQAENARYRAFWDTDKELLAGILGVSHVSQYGEKYLSVNEDGRISYNGVTLQVAQWKQIVALKQKHAMEIKDLQLSFATGSK